MSGALLATMGSLVGVPSLAGNSVTDQGVAGVSGAQARLTFGADGILRSLRNTLDGGVPAVVRDWLSPRIGMSQFEIRWTTTLGALSIGVSGTWYNMGSDVPFGVIRALGAGAGTTTCTGNVEIRRASDLVVVAGPSSHSVTATIV